MIQAWLGFTEEDGHEPTRRILARFQKVDHQLYENPDEVLSPTFDGDKYITGCVLADGARAAPFITGRLRTSRFLHKDERLLCVPGSLKIEGAVTKRFER